MRAPVRSAPAPPGLRTAGTVASHQPTTIIKRPVAGMVQRHGSIDGVSIASGAPLRPVRSTNHHQSGSGRSSSIPSNVTLLASLTPVPVVPPSATARRNTASTGKKRAPPRPPPPKLKVRDTPPTYEDVLREDAASLVDFMLTPPAADSKPGRAPSATPARTNGAGDLIDFMTPAKPLPALSPAPPTTSAPTVAATWDDTPPASTRAGGSTFFGVDSSGGSGGGVFKVPTVIRPTKPSAGAVTSSGGSAGRSAVAVSRSMSDLSAVRGREESPPMPTMPPPPPPPSAVDADSYCRPPTPPPRPSSSASCPETPMAIALYDYISAEPDDLSFRADDSIRLLEQVNAEWMRGATAGRQGMFPAAYVHVTVPLPQQLAASEQGDIYCSEEAVAGKGVATYHNEETAASGGDGVAFSEGGVRVMAQYDFNGTDEQDLSFQAGDQVLVMGKLNDEWGYGSRHTVQYGQFPLSFVDVDPAILPLL